MLEIRLRIAPITAIAATACASAGREAVRRERKKVV
jgi:hypothetical protein